MRTTIQHLPADVHGLSPIARAALAAGASFPPIPVPLRMQDVPKPEERLGHEERGVLADLLSAGYGAAAIAPRAEVTESIAALREEGAFCIVTGQQPGLFASPLYSLYKALQACRASRELSELWGTPVVPVFWNHADDHDIAEVHHAWQLNRNLDLEKVALAGLSSGRTPLGDLPLDADAQGLAALRAQLRGTVEEHKGADDALDLFMPRDGETLPRALSRVFNELLGEYGLVIAEPEWIRPLLSSEMGRIVSRGEDGTSLVDALRRGEAELSALDLPVAIGVGGTEEGHSAALVYRSDRPAADALPERIALRAVGGDLQLDGEPGTRTHSEVGASIVGAPGEWTAGALVRPLVQDAVFPTAAYVGGWGELGYHAQLGPAREGAGQPRTPFLPRVSMTLVDEETRYALTRVESDVETVARALGKFRPDEDELTEPDVVKALRKVGEEAAEKMLEHKAGLVAMEPALGITIKKTADHVQQSIGKVIDKAMRVHKNRVGKGARQVRRVNGMLVPRGVPQERVLGPFQFVARFGTEFVAALWRDMPAVSPEHMVVHLPDVKADPTTEAQLPKGAARS